MRQVYLDNHSGRRLDQRVWAAMQPYFIDLYGNPQSLHSPGSLARDALEKARAQVARLIEADPETIIFTSCGSEANNLALKGVAYARSDKGRHLVVSAVEHVSVLNAARRLTRQGFELTILPVDRQGLVSPDALRQALRPDTILVSIQHANPEIGTIQDLPLLSDLVHERGILFHTDAVSTAGIIDAAPLALGADLMTLSASQMYGPRGAAALFVRKGISLWPLIDGGLQERSRRSGTENLPAIVGFGAAAELAVWERKENYQQVLRRRDRLLSELPGRIPYLYLNGHPEKRLPDNINFSAEFVEGEGLLLMLDRQGIYVTSGSACTSRNLKMSPVLAALGIDPAVAQGSVTMTLDRSHTDEDIDYVLREFPAVVEQLRRLSPLYDHFIKTGQRSPAGPGTDYDHHDPTEAE